MNRTLPIFVVLLILGMIAVIAAAYSAPPENADPAKREWFQGLRQPSTGASCCDLSDCREVADYHPKGSGYEVLITPDRFPVEAARWVDVPAEKILQGKTNPYFANPVVCWTPPLGVLCFVRGTEA